MQLNRRFILHHILPPHSRHRTPSHRHIIHHLRLVLVLQTHGLHHDCRSRLCSRRHRHLTQARLSLPIRMRTMHILSSYLQIAHMLHRKHYLLQSKSLQDSISSIPSISLAMLLTKALKVALCYSRLRSHRRRRLDHDSKVRLHKTHLVLDLACCHVDLRFHLCQPLRVLV